MKTERELFGFWFKKNFHDLHEAICCGDLVAKNYKNAMFKAWKASAQREGYKLVPVEPTKEHIHRFEEITVNGDDARKYICIYCGLKKSESFND